MELSGSNSVNRGEGVSGGHSGSGRSWESWGSLLNVLPMRSISLVDIAVGLSYFIEIIHDLVLFRVIQGFSFNQDWGSIT